MWFLSEYFVFMPIIVFEFLAFQSRCYFDHFESNFKADILPAFVCVYFGLFCSVPFGENFTPRSVLVDCLFSAKYQI